MRKITNAQQNSTTGITTQVPWRVCKVEALAAFRFYVQFEDGTDGIVDLARFLEQDCGVFKMLRNVETFNAVYIEHGAVTWPGGLDLAPDRMHDELQNADVYVVGRGLC